VINNKLISATDDKMWNVWFEVARKCRLFLLHKLMYLAKINATTVGVQNLSLLTTSDMGMNFWLIAEEWEVPGLTQKLLDWAN
jgi:hypothetical protein